MVELEIGTQATHTKYKGHRQLSELAERKMFFSTSILWATGHSELIQHAYLSNGEVGEMQACNIDFSLFKPPQILKSV